MRGLPAGKDQKGMDKYKGASIGIVIECEGGHVTVLALPRIEGVQEEEPEDLLIGHGTSSVGGVLAATRSRSLRMASSSAAAAATSFG